MKKMYIISAVMFVILGVSGVIGGFVSSSPVGGKLEEKIVATVHANNDQPTCTSTYSTRCTVSAEASLAWSSSSSESGYGSLGSSSYYGGRFSSYCPPWNGRNTRICTGTILITTTSTCSNGQNSSYSRYSDSCTITQIDNMQPTGTGSVSVQ